MTKLKAIVTEFLHHLPYSATGVAAAFGIVMAWKKLAVNQQSIDYFHITHPTHIFLSAVVTTAIFWKFHRHWLQAILVGLVGTLPICTISDIFIPHLGSVLLGTPTVLHICMIEEPYLVFPACFAGIFLGIFLLKYVERVTEIGHLLHVLVSSLASLLYLIAFDASLWQESLFLVFLITLLAVWVPCCLSDIVFPLLFVPKNSIEQWHGPHCHH